MPLKKITHHGYSNTTNRTSTAIEAPTQPIVFTSNEFITLLLYNTTSIYRIPKDVSNIKKPLNGERFFDVGLSPNVSERCMA